VSDPLANLEPSLEGKLMDERRHQAYATTYSGRTLLSKIRRGRQKAAFDRAWSYYVIEGKLLARVDHTSAQSSLKLPVCPPREPAFTKHPHGLGPRGHFVKITTQPIAANVSQTVSEGQSGQSRAPLSLSLDRSLRSLRFYLEKL